MLPPPNKIKFKKINRKLIFSFGTEPYANLHLWSCPEKEHLEQRWEPCRQGKSHVQRPWVDTNSVYSQKRKPTVATTSQAGCRSEQAQKGSADPGTEGWGSLGSPGLSGSTMWYVCWWLCRNQRTRPGTRQKWQGDWGEHRCWSCCHFAS